MAIQHTYGSAVSFPRQATEPSSAEKTKPAKSPTPNTPSSKITPKESVETSQPKPLPPPPAWLGIPTTPEDTLAPAPDASQTPQVQGGVTSPAVPQPTDNSGAPVNPPPVSLNPYAYPPVTPTVPNYAPNFYPAGYGAYVPPYNSLPNSQYNAQNTTQQNASTTVPNSYTGAPLYPPVVQYPNANIPGATVPQAETTAPQQREGSGLSTLPGPGKQQTPEARNRQLKERLLGAARSLGAPDADIAKIQARLNQGNLEVAHTDPAMALNITQAEQRDVESRNRLLEAAYAEIQSSGSRGEAQQKLARLATRGEIPDFDAEHNTFISYDTDQTAVEGQPGISRYRVAKRTTGIDANGKTVYNQRMVDAREVDAMGEWLYVNPDRFANAPTLSTDAKLIETLDATLRGESFQKKFRDALRTADTGSDTPSMVSASLQPMLDELTTAYGIKPISIQLHHESPDGGTTNAWYDESQRAILIPTETIKRLNEHGTNNGLAGSTLKKFVLAELTATLAHEAKHARDYDTLKDPKAFDATNEEDTAALEAIGTNRQFYNGPVTTRILTGEQNRYDVQPVEKSVAPFEQRAVATLYDINHLDAQKLGRA
jgi:hypothetical protein